MQQFSILEYLSKLTSAGKKNRYYCPVCGGNDLTVKPKSGAYKCWHGCECRDIREALSPWNESKKSYYPEVTRSQTKAKKKLTLPPVPIPKGKITLATLPEEKIDQPLINDQPDIPNWAREGYKIPLQGLREIIYRYSETQWVSRYEWHESTHAKKRCKVPLPKHRDLQGQIKWKKGQADWPAYRIEEAITYGQGKWVLGVEGESCVEAARGLGLSAITWQGGSWSPELLEKEIKKLQKNQLAGLVYFPDYDNAGSKKAQKVQAACDALEFPCLVITPTDIWSEMPEKGDIVDWVKNHQDSMNKEQFIRQLERAIHQAVEQKKQLLEELVGTEEEKQKLVNLPNWSQDEIANHLAELYRDKLAWNTEKQEWYRYSAQTEGIWSKEPVEFICRLVKTEVEGIAQLYEELEGKKPRYTINFINSIVKLLNLDLAVRKWDEADGLLPLLNGVLNLQTKKLTDHAPGHRLTWCLPYEYNHLVTCDPIVDWLTNMCGGDRALVQLMRAYLYGIVTGRTDWQKYLELIGPGGTGKSTFTRLAIALVGANNTHTTTLKKLEGARFETASIAGKRLVLINDSERYAGSVSTLKALTGQDTLPYEEKFKQSTGGFTPTAMVIVAANETIQSSDYTSGLERRRITVPMVNRISAEDQRNLIEYRNEKIMGEFASHIPGLLNWVLEIDEVEATNIIKNYQNLVPSLAPMKAQTLVESNPIADWLDNCIIYGSGYRTYVGTAKPDKDRDSDRSFLNTKIWLYPNYCEYCQNTGTKPVALRRFVNLLSDLCKNQLGLEVEKARDRDGSHFKGLKIREESDEDPPLITGNQISTMLQNNTLSGVTDSIDNVTDSVMDETLASDGCDGCDGIFQTCPEQLNPEESDRIDTTNKTKVINNQNLPSHPSHNVAKSLDSDGLQPFSDPSHYPSQSITPSVTTESVSSETQELQRSDKGGNFFSPSEKNQNNFSNSCDSSSIGTAKEEVETNISLNNLSEVVTPVTIKSQQRIDAVTEVVTSEINWQTYPWNSKHLLTLKNRAKKVKERVLSCSTNNDLIKLLATPGASDPEIDWLVKYYFTKPEKQHLEAIRNYTQGNLFSESQPNKEIIEYDFNDIIAAIDAELERIGWSQDQGRECLIANYGKKSRSHLTDDELLGFWQYLKSLG